MQHGIKTDGPNLCLPFRDFGGEKLLQFIWQFGYFNTTDLTTTEGEKLAIISPGIINHNGGPDFSAARIRIGDTVFFGHVELHLKTSDWVKHHHNGDAKYGTVILHVVFQNDQKMANAIPVLELEPRISVLLLEQYNALMNASSFIPCQASASSVKELVWASWKERLLVERLTRKATYIFSLLEKSNSHWEEILWWLLARNFGMKVNADAFEALAMSLPSAVLAKHKHSLHQIEALLFGQAGLLQGDFSDSYPLLLQREYRYLQQKLGLIPTGIPLQFLRMRPGNFPTIRLAQLAVLVQQSEHLFSRIVDSGELEPVKELFHLQANDFLHYHYTFQQSSSFKPKVLGTDAIDNIMINTVVPLLFAYGLHHNEQLYKDKALRWLEEIAAEKNAVTRGFAQAGVKAHSAFDSQALIELKNEYCTAKKCLSCAVGNYLLRKETQGTTAEPPTGLKNT